MKSLTFIFLALVMINSAASAEGISFGAKAGLFTANITTVPAGWNDTSFKNGFAGGVYLNYAFNDNVSLQPEVLYLMKGSNGVIANPYITVDFIGKYDYIEIPLLAIYTIPLKSGFNPCFFVGPSLGINLTADIDIEGENHITHEALTGSIDYSEVTNKMEFGLVIGGGFGYAVGRGQITFDARFDLGLSKTIKGGETVGVIDGEEYRETIPEEDTKNIGFALLLGYAFKL